MSKPETTAEVPRHPLVPVCRTFDAHMLYRLALTECSHRATMFRRIAAKLERLAEIEANG